MKLFVVLAASSLLLASLSAQEQPSAPGLDSKSLSGQKPPPIASEAATWVNRDKAPTWKDLRGRVVLLVFTSVF